MGPQRLKIMCYKVLTIHATWVYNNPTQHKGEPLMSTIILIALTLIAIVVLWLQALVYAGLLGGTMMLIDELKRKLKPYVWVAVAWFEKKAL